MNILGVEIGLNYFKAAVVDTQNGALNSEPLELSFKKALTPGDALSQLHKIVAHFDWEGPIGIAFPATVTKGVILSSDRVHENWMNLNAESFFKELNDLPCYVVNHSDAAGIAEMAMGAGKDEGGLCVMLTVGQYIGSSMFIRKYLIPNTELGRVEIKGKWAELIASNTARKAAGLNRKGWAKRIEDVLEAFEEILHPDLFILGGKLSEKSDKTFPFIKLNTPLKAAHFKTDASIIGAALFAEECYIAAKDAGEEK